MDVSHSSRGGVPRSGEVWARFSLLVGALLLMVSCMPAHVASDTGRTDSREARERPSKTYHVQVRTVEAKSEADRTVSEVMTWFNDLDRDERPLPLSRVSTVPIDVRWKAPFYRVRVGPFTSKEAAESVLQSVQRRFPDAFIAKEIIEEDPASRRTFWYEAPGSGTPDDWQPTNPRRTEERRGERNPTVRINGQRVDWRDYEEERRDRMERTRERLERERRERERARRDREWQQRREQWERQRGRDDDARENGARQAPPNSDRRSETGADEEDDADERDDGGW